MSEFRAQELLKFRSPLVLTVDPKQFLPEKKKQLTMVAARIASNGTTYYHYSLVFFSFLVPVEGDQDLVSGWCLPSIPIERWARLAEGVHKSRIKRGTY